MQLSRLCDARSIVSGLSVGVYCIMLVIGTTSTPASAGSPACVIDDDHPWSECSHDALVAVAGAEKLVRAFFGMSYRDQYAAFAPSYREMLERQFGIRGADGYERRHSPSELLWKTPKVESLEYFSKGGATVKVLARWENEGYHGVRTFIFQLAYTQGRWSILDIVN
jgi:hypothetical protein